MEDEKIFWNKINQNKKEITVHLGVWFLYIICIIVWYEIPFTIVDIFDTLLTAILWMITFYSYHLFILPYFFTTRRWILLILVYFFIHIIYVVVFYGEEILIAHIQNNLTAIDIEDIVRRGSFWHTQFIIIALGYHFYGESVREKQKVLIEEQKRLLAEAELKETELKLRDSQLENLKAQFNPHFLFNALWYIYLLVQETGSQNATKAVELLSQMMRYSMKNRQVNEMVPLEDELQYANDYIALQRLRTPQIKLDYQEKGNLTDVKILPLVLISFIENACKHGKMNEEENPLRVHLTVTENNEIKFLVNNKISTMGKERSSGIGLDNVKNRLKTAYGDNFTLNVTNDGVFYTSELTIKQS